MKFIPLSVLAMCTFLPGVKSQTNYCLSFDGVNDYVNIGNVLPAVSDFTLECWAKIPSSASASTILLGSNTGTCAGNLLQYNVSLSTLYFYERTNCAGVPVSVTVTLADDTWHHLAGVRSGSSIYLYIDGKLVGSGTAYNNTGMAPFRVGSRNAVYYQGMIDEVRIWNVARSAQQIKSGMYGTVPASTAGLLAYYHFNEGSGQTITDATSNAYNGTEGANNTVATDDPTWTASPVQFGQNALSFDGTDDYVALPPAAINNLSTGTIETWVYLNSLTQAPLLSKQSNGENTYATLTVGYYADASGSLVAGTPGVVYFHAQDGTTILNSGATTLSTGTWSHVAVTFDASGATLYINGVIAGTASGDFSQPNDITVTSTRLGSWSVGGYLNGALDEVRVWNVVRTQAQIQSYMGLTLTGTESGLVTQYSANQGIASGTNTGLTVLVDGTTNNNHGILTNFAVSGSSSNYIANTLTLLPVTLTAFTALQQEKSVLLQWQTSQEQNSSYFSLERSGNGAEWSSLATVNAAGNSTTPRFYRYTDTRPLQGMNYYRLKQVDMDGKYAYSPVQEVNFTAGQPVLQLLQNPVSNGLLQFTVTTGAGANNNYKVQLYDIRGRLVIKQDAYTGVNTIYVQPLPAGVYLLELVQDGKAIGARQKIIVQ